MKKFILLLLMSLIIIGLFGCSNPQNADENMYILNISSEGEGTTEPAAGEHQYDQDSMVDLMVTPDSNNGWYFDGWVGSDGNDVADADKADYKILMNEDKEIKAIFSDTEHIITSLDNPDTIAVSYGTPIEDVELPEKITVTRDDDKTVEVFVNWNIENTDPAYDPQQTDTYEVTGELDLTDLGYLTNPNNLKASVILEVYEENVSFFKLEIFVSPENSGTTTPDETDVYPEGTEVKLEAEPNYGWGFSHWQGDTSDGNSAETTVTMDRNKQVTAIFEELAVISGKVTYSESGDGVEGITINLSNDRTTTTDSEGNWSIETDPEDTVTVTPSGTPSGGENYYGVLFEPEYEEVSGSKDNVDFEFSSYKWVSEFGEEKLSSNNLSSIAAYDDNWVVVGGGYQIHGYEDPNNKNNYNHIWTTGQEGSGESFKFDNIMDLAIINDTLYIADTDNNRIVYTDAWIPIPDVAISYIIDDDLSLNKPEGLAAEEVDGDKILYIADAGNKRVLKLVNDGSGHVLKEEWDNSGEFNYPQGIAVDSNHNIYVADFFNSFFHSENRDYEPGRVWKYDGSDWSIFHDKSNPFDVAVDAENNIYIISDYIYKYDSNGELLTKIKYTDEDELHFCVGLRMDIDSKGNIFFASQCSADWSIQKFSPVD